VFALKNISSVKRKQKQNSPSSSINCKCMGQIHSIYCDSANNSVCVRIIEVGNNVLAMMDDEGSAGNEEEEKQGKESRLDVGRWGDCLKCRHISTQCTR